MFDFLFNPVGRVSRKGIWAFLIATIVIGAVFDPLEEMHVGFVVLSGLVSILLFWPSIAISIKRFHDRNMTGWWVLTFILISIPFLIWIFVNGDTEMLELLATGEEPSSKEVLEAFSNGKVIAGVIGLVIVQLIQFVILYILPGSEGDNRFGADPQKEGRGFGT